MRLPEDLATAPDDGLLRGIEERLSSSVYFSHADVLPEITILLSELSRRTTVRLHRSSHRLERLTWVLAGLTLILAAETLGRWCFGR